MQGKRNPLVGRIPPEGISYITAAVLAHLPLKEAIEAVNQLVEDGVLRFDRVEKGVSVWTEEVYKDTRYQRVCQWCGRIFMDSSEKKFCGPKCRGECQASTRKQSTIKVCEECGKEYPTLVASRRFCSTSCSSIWKNRMVKERNKGKSVKKNYVRLGKQKWKPCKVCGIDHNTGGPTCPSRKCRNTYLGVPD